MSDTSSQRTLPSPPFYAVEGVNNLRDVGGYTVSPTTSVRRNFIYRSAHLSSVTPTGAKTLVDELGISYIYDFRSEVEIARYPLVDIPGTTFTHVPVFKDQDASPANLALRYKDYAADEGPAGFIRAYKDILVSGAKFAYKVVFEHIRDQPTQSLLFHCTAGKDRTGVFAALVLRLAGVLDNEVIGKEYELTEAGLDGLREEFIQKLLQHPSVGGDRDAAVRMTSAKAAAIIGTLEWLDNEYGGVEGYMRKEIGFNDEDIRRIKKNIIVEGSGVCLN
ncbi:TPA_exp: Uncharacterized protein A8136_6473 [Trichophyton benhamiae CBS 112371]|uniref:Tyrosine specific protein phosphatases domain-containing protein n=1 Tax=Arthroderma benhamiae (strain ATCC MYA-4681 / CBS 112371) TaxID=663331 RepID=D4ARB3_ARTBC|nr:uncharacterized protein ARB_06653 [Trichophyton benhamiae CBS 112371]EFE34256.1 hypothetical protein ARB_06653 [Trichophyton benhamiae CBS 112371]DAA77213.1 TPA_exp: Uncharacterized protein A8136_6473 [Trichophyton benhamiae CBS 112371]